MEELRAEELRLRNFIYDWYNEVTTVYELHTDSTCITINGYKVGSQYLRQFKPVPLTEEWLFKFLFLMTDEGAGFKSPHFWKPLLGCDKIYLREYYTGGYIWGFNKFEEIGEPIVINYVHQLQNLYFALTGEELEFTN